MYSLYKNEYRIFKSAEATIKKGAKAEGSKIKEINPFGL
jgi:hypothetical protein